MGGEQKGAAVARHLPNPVSQSAASYVPVAGPRLQISVNHSALHIKVDSLGIDESPYHRKSGTPVPFWREKCFTMGEDFLMVL